MSDVPNQREFTRIATALDADVIIEGQVHGGTTRDVSMRGMLLISASAVPSGSDCAAVIYLNGRGGQVRIRAVGKVIRTIQGNFAVEFRELIDPESYQHLTNLIRFNAREPEKVESEIASHLGIRSSP